MKNSLFQIIVILLCVFISGCLASIVFFAVYFFQLGIRSLRKMPVY